MKRITTGKRPQNFIGFAFALLTCNVAAAETAYFGVTNGAASEAYVIEVSDPKLIADARAIIKGTSNGQHIVWGSVVPKSASYNRPGPNAPPWTFYVEPSSIKFVAFGPEICNFSTSYVNQHVVVGDFSKISPGSGWCPWNSRVVAELSAKDLKQQSTRPEDHGLPWPWAANVSKSRVLSLAEMSKPIQIKKAVEGSGAVTLPNYAVDPADFVYASPGSIVTFTVAMCGPLALANYQFTVTSQGVIQQTVRQFLCSDGGAIIQQDNNSAIYDINLMIDTPSGPASPGGWQPGVNKHVITYVTAGNTARWDYIWGYETNGANQYVDLTVTVQSNTNF